MAALTQVKHSFDMVVIISYPTENLRNNATCIWDVKSGTNRCYHYNIIQNMR